MNSKTNLLNVALAKTLTFIQGKVADGILTSDETTEIIEELQSHMKIPSQKKKIVVKEATEEDLADIQDYLVTYLSDGEDDGEPCHLSLEEMDISKEEGELETSNNCLKIEQALKTLDTKYFKGQIGLGLGLLKISEFNLKEKKRKWGFKNDEYAVNTLNLKYKRTQIHNFMRLGKLVRKYPKMKRLGRGLNIHKIAERFPLIEKTLDRYSIFWSTDEKRPRTVEDLKFELDPVPEPLQLHDFSSPLAIRITPEENDGPCSAHTIPATPNL